MPGINPVYSCNRVPSTCTISDPAAQASRPVAQSIHDRMDSGAGFLVYYPK